MSTADQDAKFYSSIGSRYSDAFAHDPGLLSFIQRILYHLPPSSNILDVGCGTGQPVAAAMAKAGHHVTGIDISETMVNLSRTAVPSGTFTVADMRGFIPDSGTSYDAVFNILSLFLLSREEIETMTKKWAQWLPPGGLLCLCSLGAEDMDVEGKGAKWDADGRCAQDVSARFMGEYPKSTLFTKAGWRRLLEKEGFEVLEEKTQVFAPPKESETDDEPHYFVIARRAP